MMIPNDDLARPIRTCAVEIRPASMLAVKPGFGSLPQPNVSLLPIFGLLRDGPSQLS